LAAGQPLEDYLEARFFKPLGMVGTRLRRCHHDVIPDKSTGYVAKDDGVLEHGRLAAELSKT